MSHHDYAGMSNCIDMCSLCHRTCLATVHHCLTKGGEHAAPDHIGLLLACAEICQTSANTMTLGVHAHRHTCRACAEICAACADACSSMSDADEVMKRCADVCRQCADSCRQMTAS